MIESWYVSYHRREIYILRNYIKNNKKISIWAFAVASIFIWAMILFQPFKVIDPSDPKFDASKFDARVYVYRDNYLQLAAAIKVLIPTGTPKEKVDRLLVKQSKLEIIKREKNVNGYPFLYVLPRRFLDIDPGVNGFAITYDENLLTKEVFFIGYD